MFKIAICDDDRNYIDFIKEKIYLFLDDVEFFEYTSGNAFIDNMNTKYDLVFLDYFLNDIEGIEVAEKLREVDRNTILVFCTAEKNPEPSFFKVNPFRYLMKDEDIEDDISEIIDHLLEVNRENNIVVDVRGKSISIPCRNILFVQKARRGSEIFYLDDEDEVCLKIFEKIDKIFGRLDSSNFVFLHSSYFVNLEMVEYMSSTEVGLTNGRILSLARSKKDNAIRSFSVFSRRKYKDI